MTRRGFVHDSFRLFLSLGILSGLSACNKDGPIEVDTGDPQNDTDKKQDKEDQAAEKRADSLNKEKE